jgi:2-oxoglutarate ferredoxin oxidoreductase subunit alpha
VGRGGPGLGTIQPGQADYYQSVYGGGNGDYHCLVLAPASVQEMSDFMGLAKELMFKWRMPLIILSDGIIGQMMEKVVLPDYQPRRTDEEIREQCPWATNGLGLKSRKYNFMSSLELDAPAMYERNKKMTEKYNKICETEVRYEDYKTEDAEYVMVAYGCSARISMNAVDRLRAEGIKAGLLRPITLWPFPNKRIQELASQCKGMLVVELSEGQMVNDVRLAVEGRTRVGLLGRSGGVILSPDEVYEAMKGIM